MDQNVGAMREGKMIFLSVHSLTTFPFAEKRTVALYSQYLEGLVKDDSSGVMGPFRSYSFERVSECYRP